MVTWWYDVYNDSIYFFSELSIVILKFSAFSVFTLCLKNFRDIFDRNLKTSYQILVIFGKNVSDTTCN